MYYTINLQLYFFGATAILRKITPILLKRTAKNIFTMIMRISVPGNVLCAQANLLI